MEAREEDKIGLSMICLVGDSGTFHSNQNGLLRRGFIELSCRGFGLMRK